jgi:hypothetical protein
MPNYKEIETEYIPSFKPFKHGHSMRASMWSDAQGHIIYDVYSYSTRVASINVTKNQLVFLDLNKYSSTTSRQQSLLKRALSHLNQVGA